MYSAMSKHTFVRRKQFVILIFIIKTVCALSAEDRCMCVYATAQKSRHWQLLFTISGALKEMPGSWTLVLIHRDKILEEASSSSFSSTFCSCSASTVPFGGDPGLPDTIPKGPKIKTLIITCLFQNYTSVFNKIPDNFGVRKVIDVKFSKSDLLGGRLLLVGRTWHYQFLQTNTE